MTAVHQTFKARIQFTGKQRAVTNGFRPTLMIGGRKALCNIDRVAPEPLPPHVNGEATFTIMWDWSPIPPFTIGVMFAMLEGDRVVGRGTVIDELN